MTTPELVFRPEDHSYWLGNVKLPGITRILADLGYYKGSQFFTEDSRQLGQAVHTACRLADELCGLCETADEALETISLHPALIPYLQGWLLFRKEMQFVSRNWEVPMYSKRMRVAGTVDCLGHAGGTLTQKVIVDVKSWKQQGADPKRSSEIQVAGYHMMAQEMGLLDSEWSSSFSLSGVERWVVKLPGDGRYRVYKCTSPSDFSIVQASAAVWWDLVNSGTIKH